MFAPVIAVPPVQLPILKPETVLLPGDPVRVTQLPSWVMVGVILETAVALIWIGEMIKQIFGVCLGVYYGRAPERLKRISETLEKFLKSSWVSGLWTTHSCRIS